MSIKTEENRNGRGEKDHDGSRWGQDKADAGCVRDSRTRGDLN